jgi:hypothetical protein
MPCRVKRSGMQKRPWVHVTSDLDLGGRAGFQIFGSTVELVAVVEMLAAQPQDTQVALGDQRRLCFVRPAPAPHAKAVG